MWVCGCAFYGSFVVFVHFPEENLVILRKRRSKELKMSRMKFSTGERNTRDSCWSTGRQ